MGALRVDRRWRPDTAPYRIGGNGHLTALPDPLLFVGGVPRSGTTMLRNMLAAHPLLAVPDESPFIRDVYKQLLRLGTPDDSDRGWQLIRGERFYKQWGLDASSVERTLARFPARSYPDLIRAMFAAYAEREEKPLSADKTPSNAYCFDWFAERFPGSRLVHLIRDPRAVCMSLSVQPWQLGGIEAAAAKWESTVRRARAAGRQLGPRFLEIRYEELVARPREELRRLCEFAGLPFTEKMLAYPDSVRLLPDRHHSMSGGSPRQGLRRWRDELDPRDVALIELITWRTMRGAGYEPVSRGRPLRVRTARRCMEAKRRGKERFSRWLDGRAPTSS